MFFVPSTSTKNFESMNLHVSANDFLEDLFFVVLLKVAETPTKSK